MRRPFILYHWSPVSRRGAILKQGLRPGKLSRCKQWRPPYLCFSDSPSKAWGASAALSDVEEEWDLWMCWSNELSAGVERLFLGTKPKFAHEPAEYRLYGCHVPKSKIWHVGTRKRRLRKAIQKKPNA